VRFYERLLKGFILVIASISLLGIVGMIGVNLIYRNRINQYEARFEVMQKIDNMSGSFRNMRLRSRQAVIGSLYNDLLYTRYEWAHFERHVAEFRRYLSESSALSNTDELIRFHDAISNVFEVYYLPLTLEIKELSIIDIPDRHHELHLITTTAATSDYSRIIDDLLEGILETYSAQTWVTNVNNRRANQIFLTVLSLFFIVVIGQTFIWAYKLVEDTTQPISESSWVLRRISQGDFSPRVTGEYKGDMNDLKESVNAAADKLANYVSTAVANEKNTHKSALALARVEAVSEAMLDSITYASQIQLNLLPARSTFSSVFPDHAILWKPRDIVGGDIYWAKNFDEGTAMCICDCTGHGVPGALLTMLVVSILDSVVVPENCADTAMIIWMLDNRLFGIINANKPEQAGGDDAIRDGCDLAVLFIARNGNITFSSGHTSVFVCDGLEVKRHKGQNIYVGEGSIKNPDIIETKHIQTQPGYKVYVSTDGLFEQVGGPSSVPFGYRIFSQVVLNNHHETQEEISQKVWTAFEAYRGGEPRVDDVEMIGVTM
jgi:serine phosphatase RsbU (regulator of sigma subunit)